MDKDMLWLDWAVELQALAQVGLAYGKDIYDIERFERIREIAGEILEHMSELPKEKVKELFCSERGYQTPKIDTRAAIFEDDKILLVQERDGRWTLPGGWCDVNVSVGENTLKEALEEAGVVAGLGRVIAVQDRERHNKPPSIWGICKIFVECSALGGSFRENSETVASGYFSENELPRLSDDKTTEAQIKMCFEAHRSQNWQTVLD